MKLGIFTVFDIKAGAYLRPFFSLTAGTAVREFATELNNPESNFAKYPEDFHVVELGSFDDSTGDFETHKPKVVATATALIQNSDSTMNSEIVARAHGA